MAQKKSYSRYFIILQEDEYGYSLASDKLPSGYTKLETKNDKCKISYYVQNLKKEKEPYYMVLICNKKDAKKLIKLGLMNIDEYGRSEVTFEYNMNNISGTNISAELIGGAAIVKFVDSKIISVMSGFASTEMPKDWKDYSIMDNRDMNEESEEEKGSKIIPDTRQEDTAILQEEVKPDKKESKNIFEEYEQKIETVKEESSREESSKEEAIKKEHIEDEPIKKENIKEVISEEITIKEELKREETNVKEELPVEEPVEDTLEEETSREENSSVILEEITTIEAENVSKKVEENHEVKDTGMDRGYGYRQDYPTGTIGEFFRLLADGFEEIKDNCREIKKCKWYKIPINSLDDMCNSSNYNKYTIVYYPMISYYPYIKKHNHYMLGYKYDSEGKMKYLVYGIPGTRSKIDQPYGGKSGFVTWVPEKEGQESETSMGYWLMFYDFRTSTIVIPVR